MGNGKLQIRRLENAKARLNTYTKRKAGILKKARELSILCDIDIALLLFSPSGKPTLCLGENSTVEGVIARFAHFTPQEIEKRKLEGLEALKRTFDKQGHDVNIQDFSGSNKIRSVEDLTNELRAQLSDKQKRLSHWMNPESVNNLDRTRAMEDSLLQSLAQLQAQRENISKKQLMSLDWSNQFSTGMPLPLEMSVELQNLPMPYVPSNDVQHMLLPDVGSMHPQSMQDWASTFGPSDVPLFDEHHPQSQCNAEVNLQDGSFPYHVNNIEQPRPGYVDSMQDWASTFGPCDVLLFDEHHPQSQCNAEVNLQDGSFPYPANNIEQSRPGYVDSMQDWASTFGPCDLPIFDEHHPHPQDPDINR